MVRCRCCGDVISSAGNCPSCHSLGVKCPDCGAILTVMSTSTMISETQFTLVTMFNCQHCGGGLGKKCYLHRGTSKIHKKILGIIMTMNRISGSCIRCCEGELWKIRSCLCNECLSWKDRLANRDMSGSSDEDPSEDEDPDCNVFNLD